MGLEAMAALLLSVALIARRRRDVRDMQPTWSRSAAALLLHEKRENPLRNGAHKTVSGAALCAFRPLCTTIAPCCHCER